MKLIEQFYYHDETATLRLLYYSSCGAAEAARRCLKWGKSVGESDDILQSVVESPGDVTSLCDINLFSYRHWNITDNNTGRRLPGESLIHNNLWRSQQFLLMWAGRAGDTFTLISHQSNFKKAEWKPEMGELAGLQYEWTHRWQLVGQKAE